MLSKTEEPTGDRLEVKESKSLVIGRRAHHSVPQTTSNRFQKESKKFIAVKKNTLLTDMTSIVKIWQIIIEVQSSSWSIER